MNNNTLNKLITEALAIEARDAKEAGALGYMTRALVQATLPHSRYEGNEFTRRNGLFTLSILSPQQIGLPYGTIPRLLIAWITTEAVKTKKREIILGHTLSEFMTQLDLIPTGGRWGTITRLREQMKKLFSAAIFCTYDEKSGNNLDRSRGVSLNVASAYDLWWNPKAPQQAALFESTLTLGEEFFNETINHPVPIDMRALKALSKSPLAIDIYCWLTYRMSYLKNSTVIPWQVLQVQFGSNYAIDPQGVRNFKKEFIKQLQKVYAIYGGLKISSEQDGLVLHPSKPHIAYKKET